MYMYMAADLGFSADYIGRVSQLFVVLLQENEHA